MCFCFLGVRIGRVVCCRCSLRRLFFYPSYALSGFLLRCGGCLCCIVCGRILRRLSCLAISRFFRAAIVPLSLIGRCMVGVLSLSPSAVKCF